MYQGSNNSSASRGNTDEDGLTPSQYRKLIRQSIKGKWGDVEYGQVASGLIGDAVSRLENNTQRIKAARLCADIQRHQDAVAYQEERLDLAQRAITEITPLTEGLITAEDFHQHVVDSIPFVDPGKNGDG